MLLVIPTRLHISRRRCGVKRAQGYPLRFVRACRVYERVHYLTDTNTNQIIGFSPIFLM